MRTRETCDYTMETLRTEAFKAVFATEPELVRKYFRKARAALGHFSHAEPLYQTLKPGRNLPHSLP